MGSIPTAGILTEIARSASIGFGLPPVIADGPPRRFPGQDIALFRGPRVVIVLAGGQVLVRILGNENIPLVYFTRAESKTLATSTEKSGHNTETAD